MSSLKKYTAWGLLVLGIITAPAAAGIFGIRDVLFTPAGVTKLVNTVLDHPEELGPWIHKKAVQKLITAQEATSFKEVPKQLILFSFIDPDEWGPVIKYTVNRKALTRDLENNFAALLAGNEMKLETGPYTKHLSENLPRLWEMYNTVLPRCNKKQEAWFNSHIYLPPGKNKNMPKCLPGDPHRTRIKTFVFAAGRKKLAAVPGSVNISEKLNSSVKGGATVIKERIEKYRRATGLLWILPLLLILGGVFFGGEVNRDRLNLLAGGASLTGALTLLSAVTAPFLSFPAGLLAGFAVPVLMLTGFFFCALGAGSFILKRKFFNEQG